MDEGGACPAPTLYESDVQLYGIEAGLVPVLDAVQHTALELICWFIDLTLINGRCKRLYP